MKLEGTAKMLRIHFGEDDKWKDKPLYRAIVEKCRELDIAGATVFQGLEGYGESAELHRAHLLRHDLPIVIAIVDTAENLDRLIPAVEAMIGTGVLATSEVEMIRVEKPAR